MSVCSNVGVRFSDLKDMEIFEWFVVFFDIVWWMMNLMIVY